MERTVIFLSEKNVLIEMLDKEDKQMYNDLPKRFTIYRSGRFENGLSWTLDKEKAEWFKNRTPYDEIKNNLYERTIDKSEVLFCTNHRKEQEIVYVPDREKKTDLITTQLNLWWEKIENKP